jgi:alpha-1,4-galacturonosyltransferase
MREMSGLIFQAKELHYDSATMLMKLKAEMQVGFLSDGYPV